MLSETFQFTHEYAIVNKLNKIHYNASLIEPNISKRYVYLHFKQLTFKKENERQFNKLSKYKS